MDTRGPVRLSWARVRGDTPGEFASADVSIAGYTMPFVVDTGANAHMMVSGLAWYLGIEGGRSTVVHDANGEDADANVVAEQTYRVVGLPPPRPETFLVSDMPVSSRLLGFLSPQALAGDGAIVLDFRASTLEARPLAALDEEARRPSAVRARPTCPRADGLPLFAIDVEMEGRKAALRVDTGSMVTNVFVGTELGRVMAPLAKSDGLSTAALGGVAKTKTLRQRITVGGVESTVNVDVVEHDPPATCKGEDTTTVGALGIDVLKRCVVTVTRRDAVVRCGD